VRDTARAEPGVRTVCTLRAINAEQRPADHKTLARNDRRIGCDRLAIFARAVAAREVGEDEHITISAHLCVSAGNVPIKGNASYSNGVVAADRDLAFERPRFTVERPTQYFENVHYCVQIISEMTLAQAGATSPVNENRTARRVPGAFAKKGEMAIGTETNPGDFGKIDALLKDLEGIDLQEIDADSLREAEFEQTRWILDEMKGKTIARALLEDTRIVIETSDGNRYFFFGFMGSGRPR